MDIPAILAFAAALFALALGLAVVWHERRSVAHWAFAAGTVVFAAESLFSGLVADAVLPGEVVYWQNWRLLTASFLPGVWIFFSLSYARGNYREFLAKWRSVLALAFLAPIGLALVWRGKFIVSIGRPVASDHWVLGLGLPAFALYLLLLLSTILVLMNLE